MDGGFTEIAKARHNDRHITDNQNAKLTLDLRIISVIFL